MSRWRARGALEAAGAGGGGTAPWSSSLLLEPLVAVLLELELELLSPPDALLAGSSGNSEPLSPEALSAPPS
eukprot:11227624-Lingulodinium_polyedra.AAC.3